MAVNTIGHFDRRLERLTDTMQAHSNALDDRLADMEDPEKGTSPAVVARFMAAQNNMTTFTTAVTADQKAQAEMVKGALRDA
jgi:hypothetical protein